MIRRSRLLLASLSAVWVVMVLACGGGSGGGRLSVEVVDTRLEPVRTAEGLDTKMVYIDWKNTGNRPVRAVYAKVYGFDEQGNEVDVMPVPSYSIYAVFNGDPGIAPGETYHEPKGEGLFVPPKLPKMPTRVSVTITKVEEKGME